MAQAQKFKIKELEIYQYKGVNRRGKKADGELKGNSIAEVKALLRQQGITPSKVKRKPKSLFSGEKNYRYGYCSGHPPDCYHARCRRAAGAKCRFNCQWGR